MIGFAKPDSPWLLAFSLGCYVSALACLVFALRLWVGGARKAACAEALLFALLVLFFFSLESLGEVRIPFYSYPLAFQDSRAPFPLDIWWLQTCWGCTPGMELCRQIVRSLSPNLPLSIPLMEASLAFAALWTARLLGASRIGLPVLTGLAALLVDSVLDPIVATALNPVNQGEGLIQVTRNHGLGLWRWVVVGDIRPDAFGIPLVNYGVWFAGPVILVTIIEILRKLGGWDHRIHVPFLDLPSSRATRETPTWLWLALVGGSVLVILLSPEFSRWLPWAVQEGLFYATVTGAFVHFIWTWQGSPRRKTMQWEFAIPLCFFLGLPIVYLLSNEDLRNEPMLVTSTLAYFAIGLFYCFSPYVPRVTASDEAPATVIEV